MANSLSREQLSTTANPAEGYVVERLTRQSRLNGANGLRTGADGRIYVAQVAGSTVSAVDPDTGAIEAISPVGGPIIAPDDLAFDEDGNLYATEITEGNVRMLSPNGESRIIYGESPVANPITYHNGRLISGECRVGGRIMELDRNGGAPRIILDNAPMPNAFEIGPDGKLYFPAMATNEIWRMDIDTGVTEVVAKDLGVPDSVKFDRNGMIVSTQVASGQVLRIDPRTGEKTVLADIGPGLDNCTLVGDRIFVSHILGSIHEILEPGKAKPLIERGLQWPLGLALDSNGSLFVSDGGFCFMLAPGEHELNLVGMLFTPNFPGWTRDAVASGAGEWIVTTADGNVTRWKPAAEESEVLASGYDRLMGVDLAPGGAIVTAEYGTGRVLSLSGGEATVLAEGLSAPMGVAVSSDGTVYVAESEGGRVVKLAGGKAETVIDGLGKPEGLAISGGKLLVIDTKAKELVSQELSSGKREAIAGSLPVGFPAGVDFKPLGGVGDMCGPMTGFTGLAASDDGTVYVSGNLEGSVLAVRPA
ncbi:MAG: SMP-30/gluconolactonase/LRE family protein [Novosphingobium sp.]|nr:SMP-30/gluconolactonase/LRE family protein [Novosphingobium sp.]